MARAAGTGSSSSSRGDSIGSLGDSFESVVAVETGPSVGVNDVLEASRAMLLERVGVASIKSAGLGQ